MSNYVEIAKEVFKIEIDGLIETMNAVNDDFDKIISLITNCQGKVILTGMGKSGHIARKISATFSSLGTPSAYIHPSEALHGDLGLIESKDILIAISNSGETNEILNIIPSIKSIGAKLISITSQENSTLNKVSDVGYVLPNSVEACNLKLAPTTSSTSVLVFGDALAITMSRVHNFTKDDFGLFHPSGTLGRKIILRTYDLMRKGGELPICYINQSFEEALIEMNYKGLGFLLILDKDNNLCGVLSDGDLRRILSKKIDIYNSNLKDFMSNKPKTISSNILAVEALKIMTELKISSMPVINGRNVIGLIRSLDILNEGIFL